MDIKKQDTLVELLEELKKDGFSEGFKAVESGIKALNSERLYAPNKIKIVDIYRFEGMTNPSDQCEVLALETQDGLKGVLIHNYGHESNQNEEMIRNIPN